MQANPIMMADRRLDPTYPYDLWHVRDMQAYLK